MRRGVRAQCIVAGAHSPVGAATRSVAIARAHASRWSAVRPWWVVVRRRRAVPREDLRLVRRPSAVARPCCARRPKHRAPRPWRRAQHLSRRARLLVRSAPRFLPHALRLWPCEKRRGLRSRLPVDWSRHRAPRDVASRSGRASGLGRRIGAVRSTRDHTPPHLTPQHPPLVKGRACRSVTGVAPPESGTCGPPRKFDPTFSREFQGLQGKRNP